MLLSATLRSQFNHSRKRAHSPLLDLHLDAGESKRCRRVSALAMSSPSFNIPPATTRNVKGLSLTISPSKRSSLSLSIPSQTSPRSPTQSYCASPTTAASSPQTPLFIQTPASSTKQDSFDTISSNASYSGYAVVRPPLSAKHSSKRSLLSIISHPPSAGYVSGTTPPTPTVSLPSARSVSSPVTKLDSYAEDVPRQIPYINGPVEVVPGVWIGTEESATQLELWAGSSHARIVNVAKEVPKPDGIPDHIGYLHLPWIHGENDLARLPEGAELGATVESVENDAGFWDAIQWMEAGRRQAQPILIQ